MKEKHERVDDELCTCGADIPFHIHAVDVTANREQFVTYVELELPFTCIVKDLGQGCVALEYFGKFPVDVKEATQNVDLTEVRSILNLAYYVAHLKGEHHLKDKIFDAWKLTREPHETE